MERVVPNALLNLGGFAATTSTSSSEKPIHLAQRSPHHIERRFALKPNLKRERALMKQHRQSIYCAGAGFDCTGAEAARAFCGEGRQAVICA